MTAKLSVRTSKNGVTNVVLYKKEALFDLRWEKPYKVHLRSNFMKKVVDLPKMKRNTKNIS